MIKYNTLQYKTIYIFYTHMNYKSVIQCELN